MVSEAIDLSYKKNVADRPNERVPETALVTRSGSGQGPVKMYADGGGIPWSVSVLREAVARNMLSTEVHWRFFFTLFFSLCPSDFLHVAFYPT